MMVKDGWLTCWLYLKPLREEMTEHRTDGAISRDPQLRS